MTSSWRLEPDTRHRHEQEPPSPPATEPILSESRVAWQHHSKVPRDVAVFFATCYCPGTSGQLSHRPQSNKYATLGPSNPPCTPNPPQFHRTRVFSQAPRTLNKVISASTGRGASRTQGSRLSTIIRCPNPNPNPIRHSPFIFDHHVDLE